MTKPPLARIVVAEDNMTIQRLLVGTLKRAGYDVVAVVDGASAIAACQKDPPDLVLLDVTMPGTGGLAVLAAIRKTRSPVDLPVIMCTSEGSDDAIEYALEQGANDYILKPVKGRSLVARVQLHLRMAEMTRQLAAQEHLAAVAAVVVTYNHEINNPLAVATMSLAQVQQRTDLGEVVDEHLARTRRALRRIADIVAATRQLVARPIKFIPYVGKTQMVELPRPKDTGKAS